MNSSEIRSAFLNYFKSKQHTIIASSSLIPADDPTLLFVNAGMVQFKDIFLGKESRTYQRATTAQRCIRAGGKHNDLENVGYTARHHTFFEMLGNFSFGDYFKEQAIVYAWEFLTQVLKLPKERLWVTVHSSDTDAEKIWLEKIGVCSSRFSRLDEDNFWSMGDTGPCGPCSEVFYDHGPNIAGGPPGSANDDGDRYIEIWNLVFMQYNRHPDGSMTPLPKPSVDTGMGLERIAAVLQNVHNNYDTDVFKTLIIQAAKLIGTVDTQSQSLQVIADHIRSCAFLIIDGVTPGNEGRGYVLRRIIRRAIRHGYKLNAKHIFFSKLITTLADLMGAAYPDLIKKKSYIIEVLFNEEQQFSTTIKQGMRLISEQSRLATDGIIAAETIFKLYDTYGFPVDLTNDYAREHGFTLDLDGYEKLMAQQRVRARSASKFKQMQINFPIDATTNFVGYQSNTAAAKIIGIVVDGLSVDQLHNHKTDAVIVLDSSPFYGERGGQTGDIGTIFNTAAVFHVHDTQQRDGMLLHFGIIDDGTLRIGETIKAKINTEQRDESRKHHSATHLLHAALRQVLGEGVVQKGSHVSPVRLRFDFSHPKPVTPTQLREIVNITNASIQQNSLVASTEMPIDNAKQLGAIAMFGEKYGAQVRVVTMGVYNDKPWSIELCGGTHVERTGDIGAVVLLKESGISAGVRRIEAFAGKAAISHIHSVQQQVFDVEQHTQTKLIDLAERMSQLQKTILLNKKKSTQPVSKRELTQTTCGAYTLRHIVLDDAPAAELRSLYDQYKHEYTSSVLALFSTSTAGVRAIIAVSNDIDQRIAANKILQFIAPFIDGRGGGKPQMAQGGGKNPAGVTAAIHAMVIELEHPNAILCSCL